MVIKDFFPTPFLFHQVSPKIANQVENIIVPRLSSLSKVDNVNTDFFNENKIIKLEEISELYKEILKCKEFFEKNTNFTKSILNEFWVQDYSHNQTHDTHNHGRNQLSIVYWVRANQDAGNFIVFDPKPQQSLFHGSVKTHTKYTEFFVKVPPIKGGILILPSYIDHRVEPGGPNCIRTTIAFNFYPNQL